MDKLIETRRNCSQKRQLSAPCYTVKAALGAPGSTFYTREADGMASIVQRGKGYSVVYYTMICGEKKQKWETYYTTEDAQRRKELV